MPRVFIGNYAFEHELSNPDFVLPEHLKHYAAQQTVKWLAVANDHDAIWLPMQIEDSLFASLAAAGFAQPDRIADLADLAPALDWELCPWGWTAQTLAWQHQFCPHQQVPDLEVVRAVNSRRFAFAAEAKRQILRPGVALIESWQALEQQLAQVSQADERWVLKSAFGMAARERILGRGNHILDQHKNWILKKLRTAGELFFEPWFDKLAEAGIQFSVPVSGKPVCQGVLPFVTDASGVYRGSRVSGQPAEALEIQWREAIQVCSEVATEIQQLGYFGPLGIDVMRYRDQQGEVQNRFLQDINARWTMGRLTLGLLRLLKPNESASWLHLPMGIDAVARKLEQHCSADIRTICTTPSTTAGMTSNQSSWVLIAEQAADLQQLEKLLLDKCCL